MIGARQLLPIQVGSAEFACNDALCPSGLTRMRDRGIAEFIALATGRFFAFEMGRVFQCLRYLQALMWEPRHQTSANAMLAIRLGVA